MDDERMDLSALDALAEPQRRDRLVAAILRRAQPELARRAEDSSPILILAHWTRPTLAAAAVLAVVSATVMALAGGVADVAQGPGFTDALEVPAPVNAWIVADREPTVSDVIIALEGDEP